MRKTRAPCKNYALYCKPSRAQEAVEGFEHPERQERRDVWWKLTGDSRYTPPPYVPTVSKTAVRTVYTHSYKGRPFAVSHLDNLVCFEQGHNRVAVCDGWEIGVMELMAENITVQDMVEIQYTDHWHETSRGVIGVTCSGAIVSWPKKTNCVVESADFFPESFTYIFGSVFVHDSLSAVFEENRSAEANVWDLLEQERDMRDGLSLVSHYSPDSSYTVVDATLPTRPFRVFRPDSLMEYWNHSTEDTLKPGTERVCTDPYEAHIESYYHTPLHVVGRFHPMENGRSLCVGATRSDPRCRELYVVDDKAVWSRITDWREPNIERRLVSVEKALSFTFQPQLGWVVKDLRVFTLAEQ